MVLMKLIGSFNIFPIDIWAVRKIYDIWAKMIFPKKFNFQYTTWYVDFDFKVWYMIWYAIGVQSVYQNDQNIWIMTKNVWSDYAWISMCILYKKCWYVTLYTAFFVIQPVFEYQGLQRIPFLTGVCMLCGLLGYVYQPFFLLWWVR